MAAAAARIAAARDAGHSICIGYAGIHPCKSGRVVLVFGTSARKYGSDADAAQAILAGGHVAQVSTPHTFGWE